MLSPCVHSSLHLLQDLLSRRFSSCFHLWHQPCFFFFWILELCQTTLHISVSRKDKNGASQFRYCSGSSDFFLRLSDDLLHICLKEGQLKLLSFDTAPAQWCGYSGSRFLLPNRTSWAPTVSVCSRGPHTGDAMHQTQTFGTLEYLYAYANSSMENLHTTPQVQELTVSVRPRPRPLEESISHHLHGHQISHLTTSYSHPFSFWVYTNVSKNANLLNKLNLGGITYVLRVSLFAKYKPIHQAKSW